MPCSAELKIVYSFSFGDCSKCSTQISKHVTVNLKLILSYSCLNKADRTQRKMSLLIGWSFICEDDLRWFISALLFLLMFLLCYET